MLVSTASDSARRAMQESGQKRGEITMGKNKKRGNAGGVGGACGENNAREQNRTQTRATKRCLCMGAIHKAKNEFQFARAVVRPKQDSPTNYQ
jgi:hypothetical protein